MSQANVELVRSITPSPETDLIPLFRNDELFDQTVGALEQFVDPEVETVAVWQGGATHTGIQGLRQLWLDWLEPWASYHSHVEDLIDAGDCVVTLVRDRARRNDIEGEVDILAGSTWEIHDGKVTRLVFYGDRDEALAAAGVQRR